MIWVLLSMLSQAAVIPDLATTLLSPLYDNWGSLIGQNGFSDPSNCPVVNSTNFITILGCECTVKDDLFTTEWVNTTLGAYAPRFKVDEDAMSISCNNNESCGACGVGMECVGIASGSTGNRGYCSACALGQYCPKSVVNPAALIVANLCPASYFCSENASLIFDCPAGFYCPEGTTSPINCNIEGEDRGRYCAVGSRHPFNKCPSRCTNHTK
jgi:hypothetical protein